MAITRRTALGAGAVALSAPWLARPAQARTTLKLASELLDNHPGIIRMREAADAISKETSGEIQLRIFPNSQLGAAQEMLNQIRSGAVDFYPAAAAGLSAVVPVVSISSMGFAFDTYDQVWSALDGKLGTYIRGEIAKTGYILAMDAMWDNGFRQVTNSLHPIETPADLKGLKLRVPLAPLYTSMFSALGAAPAGLSVAELYTSLQTKLVDGQENPLTIIDIYKYYEVQKFCSVTNHMWDGFWLLANRRSWDRISDQARPIVAKNLKAATLAMRTDVAQLNAGAADRLRQHGMLVNAVADKAPFRRTLTEAGFYATWRKTYGEEAWGELESTVGPLS